MTLSQVTKQIEKLEIKVSKLHSELVKASSTYSRNSTKIEMEWMKQREILTYLEKIQGLLS